MKITETITPIELSDDPNEFPFDHEFGFGAIDTLYVPTGCYQKYHMSRWISYTSNIEDIDMPDGIYLRGGRKYIAR